MWAVLQVRKPRWTEMGEGGFNLERSADTARSVSALACTSAIQRFPHAFAAWS